MDVGSDIELYDTDVMKLEQVFQGLQRYIGSTTNLDAFKDQAQNRLWDAGFRSKVNMVPGYMKKDPDTVFYYTTITITGRVDPEDEYDHDRQQHEVMSDLRGRGDLPDKKSSVIAMPGEKKSAGGLILP